MNRRNFLCLLAELATGPKLVVKKVVKTFQYEKLVTLNLINYNKFVVDYIMTPSPFYWSLKNRREMEGGTYLVSPLRYKDE